MHPVRGTAIVQLGIVTNFAFDKNRSCEGLSHLQGTYICVVINSLAPESNSPIRM